MATLANWFHTVVGWVAWLISLANPENLRAFVEMSGPWWVRYVALAAIIFSETGLLVGFFLPGDSLLFGAGLLASQGVFELWILLAGLSAAAVIGDAVNFYLGVKLGKLALDKGRLRFVKHEHLMAAKDFYDRHGASAIVLARFVPIVRTFTPFVAGVSRMNYTQFAVYNIAGGVGWIVSMTLCGYWLGRIPFIAEHFELVVITIVGVSVLPMVIAGAKRFLQRRTASSLPPGKG